MHFKEYDLVNCKHYVQFLKAYKPMALQRLYYIYTVVFYKVTIPQKQSSNLLYQWCQKLFFAKQLLTPLVE